MIEFKRTVFFQKNISAALVISSRDITLRQEIYIFSCISFYLELKLKEKPFAKFSVSVNKDNKPI